MAAKVFVLIPTYNVGPYVSKAIESVIAQTWQDWEMLVLDDCSTDNTEEIVESYAKKDSRIKFLRNTQNLGMLNNWNKGITFCQSPFFVKLDGDDYWRPEMISTALAILNQDDSVALVFSKYEKVDAEGRIVKNSVEELPDFAKGISFSCIDLVVQGESKMLSYSVLRQGLSILRSQVFKELGNYRLLLTEKTQASTDTEFYFRVGCHYKIHCIDQVLYYYRIHERSISATNHAEGISELKVFEVKTAINNYYLDQGKISKNLWRNNSSKINFNYILFLAYRSRVQKNWFRVFFLSGKLLVIYPLYTWRHLLTRLNYYL